MAGWRNTTGAGFQGGPAEDERTGPPSPSPVDVSWELMYRDGREVVLNTRVHIPATDERLSMAVEQAQLAGVPWDYLSPESRGFLDCLVRVRHMLPEMPEALAEALDDDYPLLTDLALRCRDAENDYYSRPASKSSIDAPQEAPQEAPAGASVTRHPDVPPTSQTVAAGYLRGAVTPEIIEEGRAALLAARRRPQRKAPGASPKSAPAVKYESPIAERETLEKAPAPDPPMAPEEDEHEDDNALKGAGALPG